MEDPTQLVSAAAAVLVPLLLAAVAWWALVHAGPGKPKDIPSPFACAVGFAVAGAIAAGFAINFKNLQDNLESLGISAAIGAIVVAVPIAVREECLKAVPFAVYWLDKGSIETKVLWFVQILKTKLLSRIQIPVAARRVLGLIRHAVLIAASPLVAVLGKLPRMLSRPRHAVLFGFASGTGFAVIENLVYIGDASFCTRLLTASLLHPMTTAVVGAAAGLSLTLDARRDRGLILISGIALAASVHGAYNIVNDNLADLVAIVGIQVSAVPCLSDTGSLMLAVVVAILGLICSLVVRRFLGKAEGCMCATQT